MPNERLDDMARRCERRSSSLPLPDASSRILTPYFAQHQDTNYPAINYQKYNLRDEVEINGMVFRNEHISHKADHHTLARKVAAESTV